MKKFHRLNRNRTTQRPRWLHALTLSALSAAIAALPVKAAEKIYLLYGPLNLSLNVSSLETFAQKGVVDKQLDFYLDVSGVSQDQQNEFREVLLKPIDLNPVQLSRFFNTKIGEEILTKFGKIVNIQGGRNGKYALRAALVQAAFDPQRFTLLNVLRRLPTNIQIDVEQAVHLAQAVDQFIEASEFFNQEMQRLSEEETATAPPVDFATLPAIIQPGSFKFEKRTLKLYDPSRDRHFYVLLYQPTTWREGKTPVVIISHGLASRPEDFSKRAEHLASYGFVVALPQHPGSDYQQIQSLLEGYTGQVFALNEFIDRPRDVSFAIDELERRNQTEFAGRLDLENVGVSGHSFGGYTALALAGAEIDFENLKQECDRPLVGYLNLSLLLQCRALELPRPTYSLRDPRVKAVIASNPVNSAIFGSKGLSQIQIPVVLSAGNYDPATPAVLEQMRAFLWLKTPNKYLNLAEGQAHVDFSTLDAGITKMIDSFGTLTLPSPDLLKSYRYSMGLAFFEVYIAQNEQFRPYLQSSYAAYLSKDENFKFYWISGRSQQALSEAIQKYSATWKAKGKR